MTCGRLPVLTIVIMNFKKLFAASAAAFLALTATAGENDGKIQLYGFIRTYAAYDSRESLSSIEDLFYYMPYDRDMAGDNDLNAVGSFRFAALTSRLGVDVKGYRFGGWDMGAKIETDFYAGVSGVTGTAQLRLRQAYVTFGYEDLSFKVGQAWHPMAADQPDVLSLNAGAPFNPFSRTPLFQVGYEFGGFSVDLAAIWQMQYTSAGPDGQQADYMKYGKTPEIYLGLNYSNDGFLGRIGVDMLSIKPRHINAAGESLSDRITTFSPFAYFQYSAGDFSVKAKTIYAQAGEHMNLNGGYGVTSSSVTGGRLDDEASWNYTPTRNSSSWISLKYGRELQGVLFAGYVKNFGTAEEIVDTRHLYFSKNSFSNMNSMWRLTPTVLYNLGKLTFGLEYDITGVQYGEFGNDDAKFGLATANLHWVTNHRVQAMVKFTF